MCPHWRCVDCHMCSLSYIYYMKTITVVRSYKEPRNFHYKIENFDKQSII